MYFAWLSVFARAFSINRTPKNAGIASHRARVLSLYTGSTSVDRMVEARNADPLRRVR
jgi:hypothetical protein